MSEAIEALRDFTRDGMHLGTPIFPGTLRAAVADYDALAARVAELEAENARLNRYASTQADSKRAWQQISENTAGEHDATLARVRVLEEAGSRLVTVHDEALIVDGDANPAEWGRIGREMHGAVEQLRAALARAEEPLSPDR